MPHKTTNPARGEAAGLGTVVHGHAIDTPSNITSSRILQARWIERRFQLPPTLAWHVAELAFARRPER
jgi:hypothetical protein